jgi:CheY-like chemotaxis protein
MHRVRLIHWNELEAEQRADWLRSYGYEVEVEPFSRDVLLAMRRNPPSAVVIDLGRIPSQGRDVAVGLRSYKDTRHVPLVFLDGQREKVARVKELLPDAHYATWDSVEEALAKAIAHPPAEPIVPESTMAGYAGAPLAKKLGIREGSVVALAGAPEGFEATLGALPSGAATQRHLGGQPDITLWFTRSRHAVQEGLAAMIPYAAGGSLWILWPKKASGVKSDLTQAVVRRAGLDAGLVDFKVASIDATWSGLRFTQRRE